MTTDALFYELFNIEPTAFLRLAGIEVRGRYHCRSVTAKRTVKQREKRIDVVLEPEDPEDPVIFVEVQAYNDPKIYWRLMREVAMVMESRKGEPKVYAVVLFLDESLKPAVCQPALNAPSRFFSLSLPECLASIDEGAGVLSVLKPLVVEDVETLKREVGGWKEAVEALDVGEHITRRLLDLLEYAILQRFPKLSQMELAEMIELTPLEKTEAVKSLLESERERSERRGERRGMEYGILLGNIRMGQLALGLEPTPESELRKKPLEELEALAADLEARIMKNRTLH